MCYSRLKLSWKVYEFKPLLMGELENISEKFHDGYFVDLFVRQSNGRGLHSSTFQLNVSDSRGTEGACRGYLEGDLGVLTCIRGRLGVCFCVKNGSG